MQIRLVRILEHTLKARIESDPSGFHTVVPFLEGCDLDFRVTVRLRSLRTAQRLVHAIEAGKAITNISIQRDIFSNDYIAGTLRVRIARVQSDLSRLGF